MENDAARRQSPLVVELTRGQEQLRQLEAHLDQSSGIDILKSLASNILSSIEKALRIARASDYEGERRTASMDSSGSHRSKNSGQAAKDHGGRDMSKKRKTQPKWTNQVSVGSEEGVEGPLDDGYSWRKYGQKDILGAKYPRGYYRCSHRDTRGCPAMKQVQRSNENQSIYDVTYRGNHICLQNPHPTQENVFRHQHRQLLLSFQHKSSGSEGQDMAHQSLSWASTQFGNIKPEASGLSSVTSLDNCFMGNISPNFISPATSESNYFSVSPSLQPSDSQFTEIMSAAPAASEPNSPMLDMDFMLDPVEFEPGFPFDGSTLFP